MRRIKLIETENGCYQMRLEELPNQQLTKAFIDSFPVKNALLNEILERRLGDGYLHRLLKDLFSPELLAIPAKKENAFLLLEEEEKKRAARRRSVSFITGIVSRFFEDRETEAQPAKKGFISELLTKFASPKKKETKDSLAQNAAKAQKSMASEPPLRMPMTAAAEAEVAAIVALMEQAAEQDGVAAEAPHQNEKNET